jgi:hypothetical protein
MQVKFNHLQLHEVKGLVIGSHVLSEKEHVS